MATPEAERAARARGDVLRSRLAPAAGALLGAAIAVELEADRVATIGGLVASLWSFPADSGAALRLVWTVIVHSTWPILAGAGIGALVVGLVQSRGFVGWSRQPSPERASPNVALALVGWLALALFLGDLLRGATSLLQGREASAVGNAATVVARELVRAFCVALCAIAAADHSIRRRTREARLLEETRAARTPQAPPADEPRVDTLLGGVERVLFAGDVAVTFGRRDGAWWAFARAQGLSARALVDAARRRGIVVRAVTGPLEILTLGAPLDDGMRQAMQLEPAA